jgi:hypothetical protein
MAISTLSLSQESMRPWKDGRLGYDPVNTGLSMQEIEAHKQTQSNKRL